MLDTTVAGVVRIEWNPRVAIIIRFGDDALILKSKSRYHDRINGLFKTIEMQTHLNCSRNRNHQNQNITVHHFRLSQKISTEDSYARAVNASMFARFMMIQVITVVAFICADFLQQTTNN